MIRAELVAAAALIDEALTRLAKSKRMIAGTVEATRIAIVEGELQEIRGILTDPECQEDDNTGGQAVHIDD